MKRISLFTIAFLGLSATALAVPYKANSLGFAAPIVADHNALPGDTVYGTIIYDNTAGAFMGLGANGSWQSFSGSSGGAIAQWGTVGNDLYYTSGFVGIGTSTPSARLEVEANGASPTLKVSHNSGGADSQLLITNQHNAHIQFYSGNYAGSNGSGSPGNTLFDFRQSHDLIIGASTDDNLGSRANYVTVRGDNGWVGIGTVTPGVTLDVNGAIRPGDASSVTTCGMGQGNGEGSIRYDYTAHNMEFCNGTAWTAM